MIIYLRHATGSQTRKLPPFVDSTDGDSEETGLTIANTDILIGKPGTTTLVSKNSGGATHISNGIYYTTFDAVDTDTAGNGELYIHKAGSRAVYATLLILPKTIYDSMFLGLGSGAISWTYTVTDSGTGLPIPDAQIWVTSDLAGSNVIASGTTDILGQITFMLDAGTVYVWRAKTLYNFVNPDTEVVS